MARYLAGAIVGSARRHAKTACRAVAADTPQRQLVVRSAYQGLFELSRRLEIEELHEAAALVQTFVLHFGEMVSSRLGHHPAQSVRSDLIVAVFVSPAPLNALSSDCGGEARLLLFNVSMGLKELEAWRLVRLQHIRATRREYFRHLGGRPGRSCERLQRSVAVGGRSDPHHAGATRPDGNTLQRRRAPRAGKNARKCMK